MRRYILTISTAALLLLVALYSIASCGSNRSTKRSTNSDALDIARPVKSVIATSSEVVSRDFVGLSTPINSVNLAFKIAGQISNVPVSKGDYVNVGQLLCQIDPRDVELALAADKSAYEQASSRYNRAKRLLEHEAVSQQEFESAYSGYVQAKSQYDNTLEILEQTSITAPFQAVIESVYVDTYQRVQAGESVIRIVSPMTNRVSFTIPESALHAMRDTSTHFSITFDNIKNVSFKAEVRDYARTSSDASGFPVTLQFENPHPLKYIIRSGISCTVTMRSIQTNSHTIALPLSAIYAPTSGGTFVWVIKSDNRVELRPVEVLKPMGQSSIIIKSGIDSGERIVSAGVYQLRNNQLVEQLK
ncbi:MAG: efflux RND transporter periplasmic adaptor subunit [Rikenellaceae bacterium]